jgi:hypothetical protein
MCALGVEIRYQVALRFWEQIAINCPLNGQCLPDISTDEQLLPGQSRACDKRKRWKSVDAFWWTDAHEAEYCQLDNHLSSKLRDQFERSAAVGTRDSLANAVCTIGTNPW